jgi:hypothetical protein
VGELREEAPDLVLTHPRPPTAAIDCIQDDLDRRGFTTRRDVRPPLERLVITSPALFGPPYLIADVAAEPDGAGSRVVVRSGPSYHARIWGERFPAVLAACASGHEPRGAIDGRVPELESFYLAHRPHGDLTGKYRSR